MSHINLNSPLPAKCEKEKLKGEIAKLREQLEAAQTRLRGQTCFVPPEFQAELSEWKQRAEAAEAKLKAASEQELVGIVGDFGIMDWLGKPRPPCDTKIYAAPIPPVDVQELQRKYDSLDQIASEAVAMNNKQAQRIAELEQDAIERAAATQENYEVILKLRKIIDDMGRKLAEQQAFILRTGATRANQTGYEELTTLLAAEYQRGRADERAEAEKEEHVATVTSSGEFNFPCLEWRSANHSLETQIGSRLYTRPLAQKPLSEELLRFLHGMDNIDGVWFGDIHPAEQGVFWWRKYLPTVSNGITEKKEE